MRGDAAELEVRLEPKEKGCASAKISLRFRDPENDAEISPVFGDFHYDPCALLGLELDPQAYGKVLAAQLFASPEVREFFLKVRATAESRALTLRLRLTLGAGCDELHGLRWELLADPETGSSLTTSERILFSRFLEVEDWRRVNALPRNELKTLVVVAAPQDLATYHLAAIDRQEEIARVAAALGSLAFAVLAPPVTLERLIEAMRPGIDVVYLVAHGMLVQGQPWLFLENEEGATARVAGEVLAERLKELERPPRLCVLASCESSAGAGGGESAENALARRLARAGMQAIVAMQGKISFATAAKFFPSFFRHLGQTGRIDEAMAIARGTIRDRPDSHLPALFLRLKGGRLWSDAHFGGGRDDEVRYWMQLCRNICSGRFIPILGSELAARICGSHAENAAELAGQCARFPLATHQRCDLPRVLQYRRLTEQADPAELLAEQYLRQLRGRYEGRLPSELQNAGLDKLMAEIGKLHRRDPDDPYRILAWLKAKIYIQASYDNLLYRALKDEGRQPQRLLSRWKRNPASAPLPKAEPSVERPAIHHIFGVLDEPETLVLTEDHYFDFLIKTAAERLIPVQVASALAGSSLLFLGLPLTDWCFRVLYRLIQHLEGRELQSNLVHVGVQVDPSLGEFADAEEARSYLQSYFQLSQVQIYWGSAEDFLVQLRDKVLALPAEVRIAAAPRGLDEAEEYD